MEPAKDGNPPPNPWQVAASAGSQLVVAVLLGTLAGRWLDRRLGTEPWLLLAGALGGICAGIYNLFREMPRVQRRR